MFNKEDVQLSYDVELSEKETLDVNMYDTPLEVYKICFPNDKKPKDSLTTMYRDIFASYLSKKNSLSINDIENIVTTSKKGMSKLDMDIYVKAVIEGEFQVILEAETSISMEIIHSSSIEELKDQSLMSDRLTFINAEPCELSDYTVYSNKLTVGKASWKD
jgi:hypothetical protein